jgi:hypothetical protein
VPNALQDPRYFEGIDGTKCMELGHEHRHALLAPIRALQVRCTRDQRLTHE